MPTKSTQRFKTFHTSVNQFVALTPPTNQRTYIPFTWFDTRTGDRFPGNFKQVIKDGGNATTGLQGQKSDIRATPGLAFVTLYSGTANPKPPPLYTDVNQMYEGYWCLPAQIPQVFGDGSALSRAENQAKVQLAAAIRAQNTHFDGMTFAGELRESIKLLRSISKSVATRVPGYVSDQNKTIARYLGNFEISPHTGLPVRVPSDRVRAAKKARKPWEQLRQDLYDRYLAFAFGVKPLLSDAQGIGETLARHSHDSRHTKVRGYGKASFRASAANTVEAIGGGQLYGTRTRVQESYYEVIYRAGLRYEAELAAFGSAGRLAELSGFTLDNFVPSIWNLLPMSFLVDYFTNVGDILETAFTDTSRVTWVCRTQRLVSKEIGRMVVTGSPPNSQVIGQFLGSYEAETTIIGRSIVVDLSLIPSPELKVPGGSSAKWLNIAALFGSKW